MEIQSVPEVGASLRNTYNFSLYSPRCGKCPAHCALPEAFMIRHTLLCVISVSLLPFWGTNISSSAPATHGILVVANQKEHTLLLVDPDGRRELAKITVAVNGHEVTVSPDGRFAYVPIYGNSGVGRPGTDGATIDVIDLEQRKLAHTIEMGKPLRPH